MVRLDAAGNLIGRYDGLRPEAPVFAIGSHVDTVPNAGKYDGVLGVLLGLAAVQALGGRRLPFGIDVIAFSEEEGVRYRAPFLGSLAAAGRFDRELLERTDAAGITMADAFRSFGLDPSADRRGGVSGRASCSRTWRSTSSRGRCSRRWAHRRSGRGDRRPEPDAGPSCAAGRGTPEPRRWTAGSMRSRPRRRSCSRSSGSPGRSPGLRATVGAMAVEPGASNVIPETARFSIDVRHAHDQIRVAAVGEILAAGACDRRSSAAWSSASRSRSITRPSRPIRSSSDWLGRGPRLHRPCSPHRLVSGAGHDAGVMAAVAPMAMLFCAVREA